MAGGGGLVTPRRIWAPSAGLSPAAIASAIASIAAIASKLQRLQLEQPSAGRSPLLPWLRRLAVAREGGGGGGKGVNSWCARYGHLLLDPLSSRRQLARRVEEGVAAADE